MLQPSVMLVVVLGATWVATSAHAADRPTPLEVAPSVDLRKYSGKWYEIARFPNRFQRDCASDVTATYSLRRDGRITVLNECRKPDGRMKSASGTARVADPKGPNTKLKVTFFWPFSGDYWIIDLDPEYRWAVVGEPGRDYLWILCRDPRLDNALYERIAQRAKQQGFDTAKLVKTRQTS